MKRKEDGDRPPTQFEKAGEHLMERETPRREGERAEDIPDRQREGDAETDRAA